MYSSDQNSLESVRGPYTITLTLSPSGVLSGSNSKPTSGGSYAFTPLRILSAGTFTISIASAGLASISSTQVTVANYAYHIALTPSNPTPSMSFSFTITAVITAEDNNPFLGSCTVGLTESTGCLVGSTSVTTITGTANLPIYCTSTGPKTIYATCPASGASPLVTNSILVTVQQNMLKITPFTAVRVYLASKQPEYLLSSCPGLRLPRDYRRKCKRGLSCYPESKPYWNLLMDCYGKYCRWDYYFP